jgi:hypothetical protein
MSLKSSACWVFAPGDRIDEANKTAGGEVAGESRISMSIIDQTELLRCRHQLGLAVAYVEEHFRRQASDGKQLAEVFTRMHSIS